MKSTFASVVLALLLTACAAPLPIAHYTTPLSEPTANLIVSDPERFVIGTENADGCVAFDWVSTITPGQKGPATIKIQAEKMARIAYSIRNGSSLCEVHMEFMPTAGATYRAIGVYDPNHDNKLTTTEKWFSPGYSHGACAAAVGELVEGRAVWIKTRPFGLIGGGSPLAGCRRITIVQKDYIPRLREPLPAQVSVGGVENLTLSDPGAEKLPPQTIRNRSLAPIRLHDTVSDFVRTALVSELKLSGSYAEKSDLALKATIQKLYVDDLGFNFDWAASFQYTLTNTKTGVTLYDKAHKVEWSSAKFDAKNGDFYDQLNLTLTKDFAALLSDPEFKAVLSPQ